MKPLSDLLQRLQGSGVLLLIVSAVLFVAGAAIFEGSDMHNAATLGVGAAIAAIALVIAFR